MILAVFKATKEVDKKAWMRNPTLNSAMPVQGSTN